MYAKKLPFAGKVRSASAITIRVLMGNRPTIAETTFPALRDLVGLCWAGDASLRPTAAEVLRCLDKDVRAEAKAADNRRLAPGRTIEEIHD